MTMLFHRDHLVAQAEVHHHHQPVEGLHPLFQTDQEVTIVIFSSEVNSRNMFIILGTAPPVPGGRPAGQALPAPLIPS